MRQILFITFSFLIVCVATAYAQQTMVDVELIRVGDYLQSGKVSSAIKASILASGIVPTKYIGVKPGTMEPIMVNSSEDEKEKLYIVMTHLGTDLSKKLENGEPLIYRLDLSLYEKDKGLIVAQKVAPATQPPSKPDPKEEWEEVKPNEKPKISQANPPLSTPKPTDSTLVKVEFNEIYKSRDAYVVEYSIPDPANPGKKITQYGLVPKKRTSKVVPPSTVIPEKPVQTTPPPINVNKKDSDSSKTWMEWWNGLGKKNNENSNNGEDAPKKTTPPAKRGKGSSKIEKLEPKNTPDISKTPAPQKVALPETITFNNPAPTVPVNPLKKTSSSPVEEEEGGYKDFRVRALKSADGKDLYEVSIAYCPEGASVCGPIQKAQGSTIEEAKKKAKKAAKDAYDAYDEMQKSKPQPKKTLLNFPLDQ